MTPSDEEVAALGRQLLAGWEQSIKGHSTSSQARPTQSAVLAVVHALTAHTHAVSRPALDLLAAGDTLAAMPLVRAAYEAAITAQWAAQTRDGGHAMLGEDRRRRRNHVRYLEQAAFSALQDTVAGVAQKIVYELDASAGARTFQSICEDLRPGGGDAYIAYRAMNHLSRPSALVVDQYLDLLDDPPHLALRVQPKQPEPRTWTFMLVASLVWAGRAMDYLEQDKHRSPELRSAARLLGIPDQFHLTEAAGVRDWEAHQGRTR